MRRYRLKLLGVFVLILLINTKGKAQYKNMFLYNYSAGIGVGTLNDFVDKKYYDGFHIDLRHFYKEKYTYGFRIGWNKAKAVLDRQSYQTDKGTISAIQTRYMGTVPVVLNFFYYPVKDKVVIPYIGGSLGGYFIDYQKWFGSISFKDKGLRPGLCPEIGVLAPVKKSELGVGAFVRFNYIFYSHEEFKNLLYFELGVSILFGDKDGKDKVECEP